MKKYRIAAALCAVFLMAGMFSFTAYAVEPDAPPEDITAEADAPADPAPEENGLVITDEEAVSAVDEKELIAPPGTGAVVDHTVVMITEDEGKEFYTIMTPDEHVFYLIIEHDPTGQNVVFPKLGNAPLFSILAR